MKEQKPLNQDVISISDNVVLKIIKKDDPALKEKKDKKDKHPHMD